MCTCSCGKYNRLEKQLEDEKYTASLGCATTEELLEEIRVRIEMDGKLFYRTIDGEL